MSTRVGMGALALVLTLGACSSPEATRMRAGGAGADVGNRPEVVEMHEGSQPYWRTPRLLADHLRTPTTTATGNQRAPRDAPPAASPR